MNKNKQHRLFQSKFAVRAADFNKWLGKFSHWGGFFSKGQRSTSLFKGSNIKMKYKNCEAARRWMKVELMSLKDPTLTSQTLISLILANEMTHRIL